MDSIKVITYNIHKGYSERRGLSVYALRDELRRLGGDVVFLQEVQGESLRKAARHLNWPAAPQYEFLADSLWSEFAYGRNSVYAGGHHGNAILSKFPIARWDNEDISQSRFEGRGVLHCEIAIPGWSQPLHCINVHLGLFARWRQRQLAQIRERIERMIVPDAPLILAGDFNDWSERVAVLLQRHLALTEVFEHTHGRPARSYPASLPLLRLVRIYTRGLTVHATAIHDGRHSPQLSDHVALSAVLQRVT
jgi:endonuclease/exonuclease/phosphatase family metal-dependent hydrolase